MKKKGHYICAYTTLYPEQEKFLKARAEKNGTSIAEEIRQAINLARKIGNKLP